VGQGKQKKIIERKEKKMAKKGQAKQMKRFETTGFTWVEFLIT
jgi:hypothetical protein